SIFHYDTSPRSPALAGGYDDRMGTTVDLIDACRLHVEAEAAPSKKQALDHFRERYTVLLDFLRSEGLLADSTLGKDLSDWTSFEFRKSHLTKEGYELVRRCHGKWRPAYGSRPHSTASNSMAARIGSTKSRHQ